MAGGHGANEGTEQPSQQHGPPQQPLPGAAPERSQSVTAARLTPEPSGSDSRERSRWSRPRLARGLALVDPLPAKMKGCGRSSLRAACGSGDTVRVVAPSRSLALIGEETRAVASERLQKLGLSLTFGRHVEVCGFWVMGEGLADGHLVGGNLCTLNLLHGTEFMPDLAGAILFVEDDFESMPHTFDRDLTSLTQQPGSSWGADPVGRCDRAAGGRGAS
jgi:hypothetical protein